VTTSTSPNASRKPGRTVRRLGVTLGLCGSALLVSVFSTTSTGAASPATPTPVHAVELDAKTATVNITLTPQGCAPKPKSVAAGSVEFDVKNSNAGAVSEAELRTNDFAHILGEVENLTPGLSGSFSVTLQPGSYLISCPGAATSRSKFVVVGKATAAAWQTHPQLVTAVTGYTQYINQNVASLVSGTQAFCAAVDGGNMAQAQVLYPQARIYYERIEPVAEIWGNLDTEIDGRLGNPVTNPALFMGFHKLEQMMWAQNTLVGAQPICDGLVTHIQQLQTLVNSAQYSPLEMASGATDLVNEAGTSKISGEEERYSNTDFIDFQANVDGSMEVFNLLKPYLQKKDPSLVTTITKRDAALGKVLATYGSQPGYDETGYVEYSQVLDPQRRQLAAAVGALAEAMSSMSGQVS
jgi:iron uptake system component EfeO